MALFSQRNGIRPLEKAIQRESIDDDLRNRLWTILSVYIWNRLDDSLGTPGPSVVDKVITNCWINFYKQPIDRMPHNSGYTIVATINDIRKRFYEGEWWDILDLMEFILKSIPDFQGWHDKLRDGINFCFEEENSAYRFVGDEIVEITDHSEMLAIEEALGSKIDGSRKHIARSLELLADRKNPDYRNSIKESISAVESACRAITGKNNATLGEMLKTIESASPLHPAFREALSKLYGYTSDGDGIRHSLNDSTNNPSYADAKFMLVICAAFVNYLLGKAAENGLT